MVLRVPGQIVHDDDWGVVWAREVSFICIQSAAAAAAASLVCCYTAVVAGVAVLLLPAAVRHRVPDGKNVAGSLNLIPVFFSLHSNAIYFLYTPWQYCCIYGLDLPPSSVITGMRGAKTSISEGPLVLTYTYGIYIQIFRILKFLGFNAKVIFS